MIRRLPADVPPVRERDASEEPGDHPMRAATKHAAEGDWDARRAREAAEFFDELAPGWEQRPHGDRFGPLGDAFDRGGARPGRRCLELGSGTGAVTPWLAARFDVVIATDVAEQILRLAPPRPGCRVLADGAALPAPDGSVDCVALINAFVFPAEVARVLEPDGQLVWVNSSGRFTPIYLSTEDLAAAMGPGWDVVASTHGDASWAVVRRGRAFRQLRSLRPSAEVAQAVS